MFHVKECNEIVVQRGQKVPKQLRDDGVHPGFLVPLEY